MSAPASAVRREGGSREAVVAPRRRGRSADTRRREARRATSPLSLLATAGITLTTLATVYGFCRIFPGWAFFPRLAAIGVAVHGVCLVGRYRNWSLAVVGLVAAIVTAVLIGVIFLPNTMTAGLIPSRATWDTAWQALADSWSQFRVTVTPVPADGGYGITLALAIAITAFLADGFAFRAYGRAEAVIPGGLLFVVTSSLGFERLRVTSAGFWLVAALAAVVTLRAAHSENASPWLGGGTPGRRALTLGGAALAAGALAASAAVIVGPSLPGAEAEPLVSTRQGSGSGTEVVSPLVDIQARLVNRSNVELFTVDSPVPRYWRLTALESFDGRQWRQERSYTDADDLGPVDPGGLVQNIEIASLGGIWLPAALTPSGVQSSVAFRFNAELGSLIRSRGDLFTGLDYTVSSSLPIITVESLAGATSTNAPSDDYTSLPDDFPKAFRALATSITEGAATDYERALALQNYFRTTFSYNANVPRGHSERAMDTFLRAKEGYCEQFAGTYAALARSLGMASRVAVGFTPGDIDETGVYHVRGKHAHAWPEVWFDGIGWVQFEPTPGRGDAGATVYTGVEPDQEGGVVTGPADQVTPGDGNSNTDNGGPASSTPTGAGNIPRNPDGIDGGAPGGPAGSAPSPTLPPTTDTGGSGGVGILVVLGGLGALSALWLLAMPPIVRALRAGRIQTPADQVLSAWRDAETALGVAGSPRRPDETPEEYAERAWRMTGCDRTGVRRLAAHATAAAYGPTEPSETTVAEAEQITREIVVMLKRRASLWERVSRRIDPRLAAIT